MTHQDDLKVFTCPIDGVWNMSIIASNARIAISILECYECKHNMVDCPALGFRFKDLSSGVFSSTKEHSEALIDGVKNLYNIINAMRNNNSTWIDIVEYLLHKQDFLITEPQLSKYFTAEQKKRGAL